MVVIYKRLFVLGLLAGALTLSGCGAWGGNSSSTITTPEQEQTRLKKLNKMVMPESDPKGSRKGRRR
jgi:hypothetical protein